MHAVDDKVGFEFFLRIYVALLRSRVVVETEFRPGKELYFFGIFFLHGANAVEIRFLVNGRDGFSVDVKVQAVIVVIEMFGNSVIGKPQADRRLDHVFQIVGTVGRKGRVRMDICRDHNNTPEISLPSYGFCEKKSSAAVPLFAA